MSKRMNRDDLDKFHDYGIYLPTRTIYLGSFAYEDGGGESGVDFAMSERFIKNLSILEAISPDPITIIMNNPGGDWYHGIAIYDAIKNSHCEITIKVIGMAMSMGAVILQAADIRILYPNARFMIHYGTMGLGDTHAKVFQKWAKEDEKIGVEMETIFLNRIHEKHPSFNIKKLKKMLDYDTILNASETIALGLADKIEGAE